MEYKWTDINNITIEDISNKGEVSSFILDGIASKKGFYEANLEMKEGKEKPVLISSKDFEDFTSLKKIKIKNRHYITDINLKDVKGLESLEISQNENLKSLVLPDDLSCLKELSIVGNSQSTDFDAKFYESLIIGAINGENKLEKIKLNQSFYYQIMGDLKEQMEDVRFKFLFDDIVRWCDVVSNIAYTERTTEEMRDNELLIDEFLSDINLRKNDDDIQKFAKIYAKYIKTFSYDFEAFESEGRNQSWGVIIDNIDAKNLTETQESILMKSFKTNNSINVIKSKKAVCEGLSKGIIEIGRKCGLNIDEIICSVKDENNSLHSICKLNVNGGSVLFDPTYDVRILNNGIMNRGASTVESESIVKSYVDTLFTNKEINPLSDIKRQKLAKSFDKAVQKDYKAYERALDLYNKFINKIDLLNMLCVEEFKDEFRRVKNQLIKLLKLKKQDKAVCMLDSEVLLDDNTALNKTENNELSK